MAVDTISVTLSANAGVSLEMGQRRIWVDALHTQKAPGFSGATPALLAKMAQLPAFRNPTAICYTHCHGDHFSKELTRRAMARWNAPVFLPEPLEGGTVTAGERCSFSVGDVSLEFLKLPHEGTQYGNVRHYGIIVSVCGCNVLLGGDCATGCDALAAAIGGRKIHAAILPFPWLTLRRGRAFLDAHLTGAALVFCHLPFAGEDPNGYRDAARRAAGLLAHRDIRLLTEPLQTEIIKI